MMPAREHRAHWPGLIALLVVALFLGARAQQAAQVVLEKPRPADVPEAAPSSSFARLAASLRSQDSLLAWSVPSVSNPFPPEPKRADAAPLLAEEAPEEAPALPPTPAARPVIAALLYGDDPSVKLRTPSSTSGWLHVGDRFAGWTVLDIAGDSVRIADGARGCVLTRY
ncbi:MAG: hypothetical protein KBD56_01985 [Candidatus Eisenbacteria bacterium]|nr:hypothetical protein [Candidatus Eisenbacteria bacterium]